MRKELRQVFVLGMCCESVCGAVSVRSGFGRVVRVLPRASVGLDWDGMRGMCMLVLRRLEWEGWRRQSDKGGRHAIGCVGGSG